jgi:ribulose-5-phosphate 4-epimerase/fuculose-1-phosphate aldolase
MYGPSKHTVEPTDSLAFCPSGVSKQEWQVRVDLAASYRLLHHFRMTDLIYNHISARMPGSHDQFLINAYGLMYHEITASNLVVVDVDGKVLQDPTGLGINPGGFTIHSAVHMARPDIACVMHTHTAATIAIACMRRGLLPLTQHAMRFNGRIAYHDYAGVYFTDDERRRLIASLGKLQVMVLRNHGSLVCGRSIVEAFDLMYYFERACQAQVSLLSCGEELVLPDEGVAEQVAKVFEAPDRKASARIWPALLRMLDQNDPGYRQ